VEKIPPIDYQRHMQAVYRDKCVDVSTVRCWAWHFKQEVEEASLCDKAKSGRLQQMNLNKNVLKK
jgi:hypothetical protein